MDCTEKSFDLVNSHVMERVFLNFHWLPGGSFLFDLFNNVLINWVEMSLGEGHDSADDYKFEHTY